MASRDETLELATYLASLTYDQLPSEVIHQAKASILNALGCALGVVDCEFSRKAFAAHLGHDLSSTASSAEADCTILGRRERTNVDKASFLNGIAITTRDFDDIHLRTVVHSSGRPLSAILPWAEKHHL